MFVVMSALLPDELVFQSARLVLQPVERPQPQVLVHQWDSHGCPCCRRQQRLPEPQQHQQRQLEAHSFALAVEADVRMVDRVAILVRADASSNHRTRPDMLIH